MSAYATQRPPEHHIHRDSEALPGARGGAAAANYAPDVTNNERVWQDNNERQFGAGTDDRAVMGGAQHQSAASPSAESGHTAYNEDRPLSVQPTSAGGVAVDGHSDVPEGKAKFTDKLIGKTQKVAGKATKNPELHEKGELREAGGKGAVTGEARAPHD
ncbi:uncharacterized protein C8Q71DRAFT_555496 [Rhodofomes roseus]|uniref:CsbD-like domain-containing protein n=1 Tax=Rhodofomes roseus TaxID=34475 RepID=A0ABQ8KIP2_9APHY|nr:uncharacterized protein C8Q71DRAFT_555496 [Rhodofomes roseus]KAH9837672.1 hypothetical protein C8Q71DRAFT_555496 [Rhodofomes roseus]